MNNKLWGHAFLLASKMGTKYHSNVLAKFDASIPVNNPLKTLYQLHSNQIPLAASVSFQFINKFCGSYKLFICSFVKFCGVPGQLVSVRMSKIITEHIALRKM